MAGIIFPLFLSSWFMYRYLGFLEKQENKYDLSNNKRILLILPIFAILVFFISFNLDIVLGFYNVIFGKTFTTFYFQGR